MKTLYIIAVNFFVISTLTISLGVSQNYTSTNDGNWSNATNWNNTSGWGANTPNTNGSSGTRNLNHNQTVFGNYSTGSSNLNIGNGNTLIIDGNFNAGGGSTTNILGTLIVNGNVDLNGTVNVLPGGKLVAKNDVAVRSSQYLNIGNDNEPEPFADFIVEGDLNAFSSGDVTINRNGRTAIFGSVNDNGGGGTILRVNDGGQMYVHEDINYSGGGSNIQNDNSQNPYGLYVNGDINNTGGGAGTTTNTGDQQTMLDSNGDFFNWVSTQENSPLPIELKSFTASKSTKNISLNWVTAKEENFSHFEVERSMDQDNWSQIGLIQGLGESNSDVNYDFTDRNAPFGVIYYRLKSVDIDDTFEYSPVVKIEVGFEGKLAVSPNPVRDASNLKIQVPSEFREDLAYVGLFDLSGIKVQEFRNFNTNGTLQVDQKLKSGMYILKVNHNGLQENIRVIVQ